MINHVPDIILGDDEN